MAGKGRQTFEKRRLDKLRQEQQAAKRERRHSRDAEDKDANSVDQDALLEKFRLLNEARAAGKVDDETFAVAEHEIKVALGMADPDPDDD